MQIIAAADMFVVDENAGDSALSSLLGQILLDSRAVWHLIELKGFEIDIQGLEEVLCPVAVRTVGLRKDLYSCSLEMFCNAASLT